MIHVLHYITGIADIKGGVEAYILNLYSAVDKEKYKFSILTRNAKKGSKLYEMLIENGIEVYDLDIHNLSYNNMLLFYKKLNMFFKMHRGEFNFLHAHHLDDPFITKCAKKWGVPSTAIHVHAAVREHENSLYNFVKRIFAKQNVKYSDFRFACSEFAGKTMLDDEDFQVLKNTISVEKFRFSASKREEMRKELKIDNKTVAICFTGRLTKVKNIAFLLQVFKHVLINLDDVELYLIGEGPEREKLVELCEELSISQNVHFLGERNNVGEVLQAMDIYMQTSVSEGFSISTLEAQSVGLPAFISTGFPKEIEITDLIHKKDLEEGPEKWSLEIVDYIRKNKDVILAANNRQYSDVIREKGYDSDTVAKFVCKMYGNDL